jgi:hypothetical protein
MHVRMHIFLFIILSYSLYSYRTKWGQHNMFSSSNYSCYVVIKKWQFILQSAAYLTLTLLGNSVLDGISPIGGKKCVDEIHPHNSFSWFLRHPREDRWRFYSKLNQLFSFFNFIRFYHTKMLQKTKIISLKKQWASVGIYWQLKAGSPEFHGLTRSGTSYRFWKTCAVRGLCRCCSNLCGTVALKMLCFQLAS